MRTLVPCERLSQVLATRYPRLFAPALRMLGGRTRAADLWLFQPLAALAQQFIHAPPFVAPLRRIQAVLLRVAGRSGLAFLSHWSRCVCPRVSPRSASVVGFANGVVSCDTVAMLAPPRSCVASISASASVRFTGGMKRGVGKDSLLTGVIKQRVS